jgi:hypothetical protein
MQPRHWACRAIASSSAVRASASGRSHLPARLQLKPPELGGGPVTVVGDTHGQFHDVLRLFDTVGHPSSERIFVFNGEPLISSPGPWPQ